MLFCLESMIKWSIVQILFLILVHDVHVYHRLKIRIHYNDPSKYPVSSLSSSFPWLVTLVFKRFRLGNLDVQSHIRFADFARRTSNWESVCHGEAVLSLEIRVVLLLAWLPFKDREHNQPCYFNPGWGNRWIDIFLKGITVKWK